MAACLDPPNRAIVTELVSRGSLWEVLRTPDLFQVRHYVNMTVHPSTIKFYPFVLCLNDHFNSPSASTSFTSFLRAILRGHKYTPHTVYQGREVKVCSGLHGLYGEYWMIRYAV